MLADSQVGRVVSFVGFSLQGLMQISLANHATQVNLTGVFGIVTLITTCLALLNFTSTVTTSRSRPYYLLCRDACLYVNALYGWIYIPAVILYDENAEDSEFIAWFLRWSGGGFPSGGAFYGLVSMTVWTIALLGKVGIVPWPIAMIDAMTNREVINREVTNREEQDLREAIRLSEEAYRNEVMGQGRNNEQRNTDNHDDYMHINSVPPPSYEPGDEAPPPPNAPRQPQRKGGMQVILELLGSLSQLLCQGQLINLGQEDVNEARSLFLFLNGLTLFSLLSGSLYCNSLLKLAIMVLALVSVFQIYIKSRHTQSQAIMQTTIGLCGWVVVGRSVFGRQHAPAGSLMVWFFYTLMLITLERCLFPKVGEGWLTHLNNAAR